MSSGKTEASLICCLGFAQSHPNSITTITTDTVPNLRNGAMRDFKKILEAQDLTQWFEFRATVSTFTYLPNNALVEFVAMDDPLKARGSRRDVLYVNEANRLRYDTFDQLASRTRNFVILDYNPSSRFWVHDELLDEHKADCDFFISTYKDNEALSDNEIANIERHDHSSNWWRVYGLGQIGELEGNIYTGWTTCSELPESARLLVYGLDYGDSPDPTAVVSVWKSGEDLYFREMFMQANTLISDLGDMIVDMVATYGDKPIICDYGGGGAALIRELQSRKLQAVPADKSASKGGSSVLAGIAELQQCQNVHIIGKELESEYLAYQHKKNRSGVIMPTPVDGNDHLLDALRYAWHSYSKEHTLREASEKRAQLYGSN